MATIFRYALARFRGQILGWGVGLLLVGALIMATYDVVRKEQEKIAEIAKNFEFLVVGFGGNLKDLTGPASYLSLRYFSYMPLILGVFAVLNGSGLLAADEENGTLDLVLAHPVSRLALFAGRWLAFVTATVAILGIAWLGLAVPMVWNSLGVTRAAVALPFLSLLAVLLLFGNLALLLSMLLPSRRLAAMAGGMVVVASFFLTMLARLDKSLEPVGRLSPLHYYQSGEAINGLNGAWLAGLLGAAGLCTVLAAWRFERRDIRVSGEREWRWPFRCRKLTA